MVHADPFHSYAVAIVVVSESALEHWAQSNAIQYDDFGKLCRSKEANKEVLLSLQKVKSLTEDVEKTFNFMDYIEYAFTL